MILLPKSSYVSISNMFRGDEIRASARDGGSFGLAFFMEFRVCTLTKLDLLEEMRIREPK